jgi:hypothetical protein
MMNDKGNEMKTMFVNFLAARDGKVELYTGIDMLLGKFSSTEELVEFMKTTPLDFSRAYASSSMDFASEYGFDSDGMAWNLIECALETA